MQYPKITFTITTFKRLNLFLQTMKSFKESCSDIDLIIRWILIDDGSDDKDIDIIKEKFPFFQIHRNTKERSGQPVSLNKIIEAVHTEWFFHCEDDWLFLGKSHFIRDLFDVAFDDSRIKNIILRNKVGNIINRNNLEYNLHRYDPVMERPLVKKVSPRIESEDCNWYGYSWNPGLHHIPTLKHIGHLDEEHSNGCRKWDRAHALKYLELGFKRANLVDRVYIDHIGRGQSEYVH